MTKHEHYTKRIKEIFKTNPESKTVAKRYNTIRYALYEEYNEIMDLTSKDRMVEFLKDVISMDRKLRMLTEDVEQEEKKILSQEWQIQNLFK